MYRIEIGESGTYRDATPDEAQGINDHRVEYPKCDGTKSRDNGKQTLMRLRCRGSRSGGRS